MSLYKKYSDYFIIHDEIIGLDKKKIVADLVAGTSFDFISHTPEEAQAVIQSREVRRDKLYADELRISLLQCDKQRAT